MSLTLSQTPKTGFLMTWLISKITKRVKLGALSNMHHLIKLFITIIIIFFFQLSKKHRDGHMVKVDWLDRLTFREIEMVNEQQKRDSNFMYLMIEFPFIHFEDVEYTVVFFEKVQVFTFFYLKKKSFFITRSLYQLSIRLGFGRILVPIPVMTYQLSLVTRKTVVRVSAQVRLKPACSATETNWGLEILDIETIEVLYYLKRTTEV